MSESVVAKNLRIWLGGSFDPIHLGHLAIIKHIAHTLNRYFTQHASKNCPVTATIALLPTAKNPLKANPTASQHRLAMLDLAVSGLNGLQKNFSQPTNFSINFAVDTSEIYQPPPIFTFNTFLNFRKIYPDDTLIFVVGIDSFLNFANWYQGNALPNLCHLWVMPRPIGEEASEQVKENLSKLSPNLQRHFTFDLTDLFSQTHGKIYLDQKAVLSVSSSQIRVKIENLQKNDTLLLTQWLSASVLDYILANKLYSSNNTIFP